MNVAEIRADLVGCCPDAYTKYPYAPESVGSFPAVIAMPPRLIEYRKTLGLVRLEIALTVVVSAADFPEAQRQLDAAISSGSPESVLDAIEGVTSTEWETARVMSIEAVRAVKDGAQVAMAEDVIYEVFSKR